MKLLTLLAGIYTTVISFLGFSHPSSPAVIATSTPAVATSTLTTELPAPSAMPAMSSTKTNQTPSIISTSPSKPAVSSTGTTKTSPTLPTVTTSPVNLPAGSAWLTMLPLGDGDYVTSGPKQGYLYLCAVASGGEGAKGNPSWISGNIWYPSEKVAVEGSVSWPDASYSMIVANSTRLIKSNGEPTDHDTGIFPIQKSDPAYQFDANPNSIEAQNYSFSLPAYPTMSASPNCIYGEVGIMNDGVPLFDGFDAEYRDAVAHETQDAWEGHPDEGGVYHNHGFEFGPVKKSVSTVVGFALDGFPITGSLLPDGNYLHTDDLDECHGITSSITLDGKQVTTYHYVLTQDFPYSVSCFRGKSYEPKPNGGGAGHGATQFSAQTSQNKAPSSGSPGSVPPAPPQAAIDACSGKSVGASCTLSGGPSGTCAEMSDSFACKPT